MTFRFVFALAVLAVPVWSYSAGAPEGACGDLVPQHHVAAQTSPAPYSITLSKNQIRSGESVQVTVSGRTQSDTIKGLLVQARVGQTPVGQFDVAPNNPYVQLLNCGNGKGSAVTHKKIEGTGPSSITFNWVAPRGLSEQVTMVYTVALNGGEFWVGERSAPLRVN